MGRLPMTSEILRGLLLERTIRKHARGRANDEGHLVSVFTVIYRGGRTMRSSETRRAPGSFGHGLIAGEPPLSRGDEG